MSGNVSYRRGLSFARGTSIDPLVQDAQREILYSRWQKDWPEPLSFSGGTKDITCEMIVEVGLEEIVNVYGKKIGKAIFDIAVANAGR
jgi:hypothetical protein